MGDSTKKIFIGGLSFETTDDVLRSHFSAYGSVTDAIVMKDPCSRRSRGFGFITYAESYSVDEALKEKDHIIDNRKVEAKRAVPRSEPTYSSRDSRSTESDKASDRGHSNSFGNSIDDNASLSDASFTNQADIPTISNKIFVGGLHYETRDGSFRAYFEDFGKVTSAEVMFNRETHKSRGFGFVVFEDDESANKVLGTPHHTINGKLVEVKRAIPRSQASSVSASSSSALKTNKSSKRSTSETSNQIQQKKESTKQKSSHVVDENSGHCNGSASSIEFKNNPKFTGGSTYAAALRFGGRKQGNDDEVQSHSIVAAISKSEESSCTGSPLQLPDSQPQESSSLWQTVHKPEEKIGDGWSLNGGLLPTSDTWGSPFISSSKSESDTEWLNHSSLSVRNQNQNSLITTSMSHSSEVKAPSNSILLNSSGALGNGCLGSLMGSQQPASFLPNDKENDQPFKDGINHIHHYEKKKNVPITSDAAPLSQDDQSISLLFAGLGLGSMFHSNNDSLETEISDAEKKDTSNTEFIDSYFGSFHQYGKNYPTEQCLPPIHLSEIPQQLPPPIPPAPVHVEQPQYAYAPPYPPAPIPVPGSFAPQMPGAFNSNVHRYDGPEPMGFHGNYPHPQGYPHPFSQPFY
mmetsp:Transcript_24355/g.31462  ORF Transcript_24355/g.31462 Transcript_24355/m.31462 type:complete len:633 (+) Transcript_24355:235-2133(+)